MAFQHTYKASSKLVTRNTRGNKYNDYLVIFSYVLEMPFISKVTLVSFPLSHSGMMFHIFVLYVESFCVVCVLSWYLKPSKLCSSSMYTCQFCSVWYIVLLIYTDACQASTIRVLYAIPSKTPHVLPTYPSLLADLVTVSIALFFKKVTYSHPSVSMREWFQDFPREQIYASLSL